MAVGCGPLWFSNGYVCEFFRKKCPNFNWLYDRILFLESYFFRSIFQFFPVFHEMTLLTFCVHWMKLTFLSFFVRSSGSVPSDRIVASSMSTFPPLALKLVVHSEARRLPVEVANQALMPGSSICGGRLAQSITPRSCRWLRVSSLSNISRKKAVLPPLLTMQDDVT